MSEPEVRYDPAELGSLLDFIHRARGFDFSGYKTASLQRRLGKRLGELALRTPEEYRDYLEANPHEFAELFDTILINVTSFFRDKPAWTFLSEEVIPPLLEGEPRELRVWSAGCASGEEAYTIAIVLAEALGERQFRERVKIYATDADGGALAHARRAVYTRNAVRDVPPELLDRYFEGGPKEFAFRGDLRRSVIFGRNDLVQDAPISRVDLLLCRNVLMYFTPETQLRILERLNFALSERGVLFLGKSEMLIAHGDLFVPRSLRWRMFQRAPGAGHGHERVALLGHGALAGRPARFAELRAAAASVARAAQILVSRDGFVADLNQSARELLDCAASDIGRPFQDLAISYHPVDLRLAIDEVYETGQATAIERVSWSEGEDSERVFEVQVRPVDSDDGRALGVAISFEDVTALVRLIEQHDERKRELEATYEELQSTVEELETTNEELQSTNEELETTNEELQSTNEELETMNEELQSTNDELETMNRDELERMSELDRVNLFLEGILTSLGVGLVVLGPEHEVRVWNPDSTELWGLRADEVEGKRFADLDIGLPVADLQALIEDASGPVARSSSLEVDAVNRRGRRFRCRVRVLPLATPDGGVTGVLMLMVDAAHAESAGTLSV
jgi:two-component system, chemotaxis family, CheB/CheR fusion protein